MSIADYHFRLSPTVEASMFSLYGHLLRVKRELSKWFLRYLAGSESFWVSSSSSHLICLLHLVLLVYDSLLVQVASYIKHDRCGFLILWWSNYLTSFVAQFMYMLYKLSAKQANLFTKSLRIFKFLNRIVYPLKLLFFSTSKNFGTMI